MSGRRAKAARRAAARLMPALEHAYESKVSVLCPASFRRRLLWFFRPSVKAKDQSKWDVNRAAYKSDYVNRGLKKIAHIAVRAMRFGLR